MNTVTTKPTKPVLYVIWFREGKGTRWTKVGRTATHAEAVTLCGSRGDWWISPLYDPALAGEESSSTRQPTLFE